jgi:hypothetical protein
VDFGFSTFGLARIYRVVALESRLSTTIHDCPILHGTTDFNTNEGLVNKTLFGGNLILASRGSGPIDIIGRMGGRIRRKIFQLGLGLLLRIYVRIPRQFRVPYGVTDNSELARLSRVRDQGGARMGRQCL